MCVYVYGGRIEGDVLLVLGGEGAMDLGSGGPGSCRLRLRTAKFPRVSTKSMLLDRLS